MVSTEEQITDLVVSEYTDPTTGKKVQEGFSYAEYGDGAIQAAVDAVDPASYDTNGAAGRVAVWPRQEGGGTNGEAVGWQTTVRIDKRMYLHGASGPQTKIVSSDSDATIKTTESSSDDNSDDIFIEHLWVDNEGDGAGIKVRNEEAHLFDLNVDEAGAAAIDLNYESSVSKHIVDRVEIKGGGQSSGQDNWAIAARHGRQTRLSNIVIHDEFQKGMKYFMEVAGPATLSNILLYGVQDDGGNPAQTGLKLYPSLYDGGSQSGEGNILLNNILVESRSENPQNPAFDKGIVCSTQGGVVEGANVTAQNCATASLDMAAVENCNIKGYFPNGIRGWGNQTRGIINGLGKESDSAEKPTASKWEMGDIVYFVDTADGTGTGMFQKLNGTDFWDWQAGATVTGR